MNPMRACAVAEIVTPKKILLNGLWFGSAKPKRVYIWVHGLGSSMFSKIAIVEGLTGSQTAVLTFNNRGHDSVARVSHVSRSAKQSQKGGAAHEVFTDCVDDIQGAINFAKARGAKEVYLIGHSTGCQKSVYWAAKKGRGVKGIVLLAPISDYAAEVHLRGKAAVARAVKRARSLVAQEKMHAFLPDDVWHELLDSQRFLSLYSGEGAEEIFPYWHPTRKPRTLQTVKIPLLILLAENDEYADRSAMEIAAWFQNFVKKSDTVQIIPEVEHGFRGGEASVVASIRSCFSSKK